jgi:hypothetical protein
MIITQIECRMFVISRTRSDTDSIPQETIEIAGTTGNIYHVTIGLLPSCTCPDNNKGNQCKHIIYVSIPQGYWKDQSH